MFRIKAVRPLFTGVVTTANRLSENKTTEGGLLLTNKLAGTLNPFQIVVSVGDMVKDVKPGDIVMINFKRYAKAKHVPGGIEDNVQSDNMSIVYEIPHIDIDGKEHLFLQSNDIEYVVTDYDVDDGGLLE